MATNESAPNRRQPGRHDRGIVGHQIGGGTGKDLATAGWAMVTAGVPTLYIAIACLILVGLGIITGVSKTRSKDPSS